MSRVRSKSRPHTREDFVAIATRLRPKDWTRAGFRARAAQLAVALLKRGVALDVLRAQWPGSEEHPDTGGVGPYAKCWHEYGCLMRSSEPARRDNAAALQQAILDGILERPLFVVCTDGVTRGVYAKALPVHFALTAIDEALGDPSISATTWALRVTQWVWIVTTPGPLAPFDVLQPIERWPAPPSDGETAWLGGVSEFDLLALVQAYHTVDREAIRILCAAFPRHDGAPSRLGLAGFLGSVAKDTELATQSAKRVFSTHVSEAIAHDEARQRAEQEAAAKKPPVRPR